MKKNTMTAVAAGMALIFCACSSNAVQTAQSAASQVSNVAASAQSAVSEAVSTAGEMIAEGIDADKLFEMVSGAVSLPDMVKIDPAFNYGVSTDLCHSYVFYRAKEVTEADTIAIFLVKDAADVGTIKAELETAKGFDIDSANGYNPDTFEMFSNSEIRSAGNVVFWIVSEEAAKIEQLITGAQ